MPSSDGLESYRPDSLQFHGSLHVGMRTKLIRMAYSAFDNASTLINEIGLDFAYLTYRTITREQSATVNHNDEKNPLPPSDMGELPSPKHLRLLCTMLWYKHRELKTKNEANWLTMPALRCMLLCLLLRHLLSRGAMTLSVARSTRVTNVVASRASSVDSVSSGLAITRTRRSTCPRKGEVATYRVQCSRLTGAH